VCECEFDATGVALSQTDKHNMRHYSSRKRVLTREMCLSTENIRNALLARQTQEKERIPRDKRSLHGRHYREPQHALQCLKASSKEEQVGVTQCARENEINELIS
jgi:hypothetical protein